MLRSVPDGKQISQGRLNEQAAERHPVQAAERHLVQAAERHPVQAAERHLVQVLLRAAVESRLDFREDHQREPHLVALPQPIRQRGVALRREKDSNP